MKLTLSGDHLNSTYADESGRVLYKVHTTSTLPGGSTTVTKLLPDDIPRREDESGSGCRGDRFAHFARVDWKSYHIFAHGEEIATKKLFRREGWKRHRVFVGEDGKEYKWVLGPRHSELQLNDGSRTQVAKFHQRNILGIFGEKKSAVLEIFPAGETMIDAIMLTFVYVETARRREK
ncbi:hypothetical protein E1B28_002270 [Marasmius oreades]|uniref:DUF6593 domain-containing protein n=1 Tax=Marasmius oreades TaxID=181124 RepID=A0A9P7RMB4_9AGAR|nr:uncharacterized protein E1B28_002270 [Marasmius oreades]KAG7086306.1 hypothetical protein E1B28_002270 [Marasmius oreades]